MNGKELIINKIREHLLRNTETGASATDIPQENILKGYQWPGCACIVYPPANDDGESLPTYIETYIITKDNDVRVVDSEGMSYSCSALLGNSNEKILETLEIADAEQ